MVGYNHPMERYKDSRYFSAVADDTRGGSHSLLFGRPRLDFREDAFTRTPAEGTSSQHFRDSVSTSFKTAGPPENCGGF